MTPYITLFKKLIVAQLINKYPAFYETRTLITVLIRAYESDRLTIHIRFFKPSFNIILLPVYCKRFLSAIQLCILKSMAFIVLSLSLVANR